MKRENNAAKASKKEREMEAREGGNARQFRIFGVCKKQARNSKTEKLKNWNSYFDIRRIEHLDLVFSSTTYGKLLEKKRETHTKENGSTCSSTRVEWCRL